MAGHDTLRAFFAVELSPPLREEARDVVGVLRDRIDSAVDVRWAREEGWHVTLRFLGQLATSQLGELLAAASEAVRGLAPFELSLGGAIAFPPRRARVLALDLVPHAPLAEAAAALERAAVGCGFEAEERVFKPHLTLGRIKAGGGSGPLRARDVSDVRAAGLATQTVSDLVLLHTLQTFRSELHSPGARYAPLGRIGLGGTDHP